MTFVRENSTLIVGAAAFLSLLGYFIWNDSFIGYAIPVALLMAYCAVFYTRLTFFIIIASTPLSINIEEYTDSFGLFVPTEPLLFGTLVIIGFQGLRNKVFPDYLKSSPLYWIILVYFSWLLITSITSSNPVASLKFLLVKCWFIIPVLFYGSGLLTNKKAIWLFLWLFTTGMVLSMTYTLVMHANYAFGEKESHWVMWPFFKDHTIYGALVALVIPLIFAMLFAKKHSPFIQFTLYAYIVVGLLALYFSYTRAAQLSLVLGLAVYALIKLRVKFSLVAGVTVVSLLFVWFSWDSIQQELERNKFEHTTSDIGERFQSAANVTTDASNLERINRWTCALEMFQERPVVGFGPGTYAFEYARFQRPENLTIISTNFGVMGNAHSEYLGPLAETGLIGMLIIFAIVVIIFYLAIDLYQHWPKEDKEVRTIIMGLIVALVTYFIHGFLNNYLDTDKASVPIWSMCAIVLALRYKLKTNNTQLIEN